MFILALFALLMPPAFWRALGYFLCGALFALCMLLAIASAVLGIFPLVLAFMVLAYVAYTPFRS